MRGSSPGDQLTCGPRGGIDSLSIDEDLHHAVIHLVVAFVSSLHGRQRHLHHVYSDSHLKLV